MITRCRFAPSPSGLLHVGGARSALFNHLFARQTGGVMILRSEDTDQARSSEASERSIMEDMRWLGIDWQEGPDKQGPKGPYRQSERLNLYNDALQQLLSEGKAYQAWDTTEELRAQRTQAQTEKRNFRYQRQQYSAEQVARFKAEGRSPVVRLAQDGEGASFTDLILGPVDIGATDLDDFIIFKADGFPTYHFAVVVDDHHMQVTHVLRGQEHLKNTARHLKLYAALGWSPPQHGHMPLIFSMSGSKMSKRDKAKAARADARAKGLDAAALAERTGLTLEVAQAFMKKKTDDVELAMKIGGVLGTDLPEIDVLDFRRSGYLPEALVNFLALLGWNPGEDHQAAEGENPEIFSLAEMERLFTLDRVGSSKARFDRDKLRWMNGMYMRSLSPDRLMQALRDYLSDGQGPLSTVDDDRLLQILTLFRERAQTFRELEASCRYLFDRPTAWGPAKAIKKHLLKGERTGLDALRLALPALQSLGEWTEASIEAAVQAVADAEYDGRVGKLAQPLRIASTGGPVSPPIFGTLALIGQEETVARVQACLETVGATG